MTDEMRLELNDFKADLSTVKADVGVLKTDVGALGVQMSAIKTAIDTLAIQMSGFTTETDSRLGRLETISRNTALVVAGHTGEFGQINQRLTKLDELDGLKNSLEVFTAEIIASRHERALAGKSFSDQQATLTDHELRLTRIELRGKQS